MWSSIEVLSSPLAYLLQIISVLVPISLLVYMHYDAKYRNKVLSVIWYICGFVFPLITAIIYICKRKKFPAPETKICLQCGNQYPEGFTMCNRCLIELPEHNEKEKDKHKKIAATTFLSFWILLIISTSLTGYLGGSIVSDVLDFMEEYSYGRIALTDESGDDVYYDKMGNKYDNPYDVIIYGENGEEYTYMEENEYSYDEYYYIDENGKKYESIDCYVNEDGFFAYNEELDLLCDDYVDDDNLYDEDSSYDYDEEDFDYNYAISEVIDEMESYRYYEIPYVDEDGNLYYWAEEASWNEKGELITAENDPTIAE